MTMPSKVAVLYDQTSAANAALDTGVIDVSAYDAIGWYVFASAGITASTFTLFSGSLASVFNTNAAVLTAGQINWSGGFGLGSGSAIGGGMFTIQRALPPAVQFTLTAAGVGITLRLFVYGRRNHRGPDVSINPD